IYSRPMLASVIGAVETALLRFDDRIDAIGISSGDGDADPAENSIGKTFPSRRFHVTPLSSDRYNPLPGPPLEKNHGCRRACQRDANTMFGLCGSKTMSMPPVFSSLDKTFVQV